MQNQYELKHVFACLPRMERGAPVVIGGDPKGNNFLYTNGKCVIIRNIENPAVADIYTEHAHNVIVAKYAPSGFYIASGDAAGKIRIWDTTQKEHLLKYEYTPISGKIKDIAWTEDSKRICTAGEGREKFASVFLWDTGSSVGDVIGHSKAINSVDIRHKRPYRLVTGSDDTSVCFYEGPPFKFKTSIKDHSRFVNCIRYSPDGSRFVSASADGKILIFDGTTAEPIGSLGGEKAHNGGVYAVSWNADSSQLISASGDKTVKLWDVGAGTAVTTFNLGSDVSDQQLGCLWQNDHLLSISLSGYINYLDKNNPDRPIRTIKGHNKSIQCVTVHKCDDRTYIYSGSHDGHINYWDADSGDNDCFSGKGHTNQVNQLVASDTGELVTCSMDDTLRYTSTSKKDFSPSDVVKMDFQPRSVSVAPGGLSLAVCIGQVVLLKDNKKVFTLDKLDYEPEVGTLHPDGSTAAIGSNGSVYLYSIQGNTLKDEGKTIKVKGVITDMAYSNDGAYLATVSTMKILSIFSVVEDYAVKDEFYGHHAKTVALAWSPDNQHIATAGMDMLVFVWTLGNGDKRIKIADAHRLHHVCGLAWKDEHTLITVAHDACVKQWTIRY